MNQYKIYFDAKIAPGVADYSGSCIVFANSPQEAKEKFEKDPNNEEDEVTEIFLMNCVYDKINGFITNIN